MMKAAFAHAACNQDDINEGGEEVKRQAGHRPPLKSPVHMNTA